MYFMFCLSIMIKTLKCSEKIFYMLSNTNNKRILFISHDATRTGAPILLLNLAQALRDNHYSKYILPFLIKQPPYDVLNKFSSYPLKLATDKNYSLRKILHLSKYSLRHIKKSLL